MDQDIVELPPDKVAFIIDGEVVEILYVNEKLAAILNSNPIIVDVSGMLIEDGGIVQVGSPYDPETKTFTPRPESN